jgi:hypothetical protein
LCIPRYLTLANLVDSGRRGCKRIAKVITVFDANEDASVVNVKTNGSNLPLDVLVMRGLEAAWVNSYTYPLKGHPRS